VNGSVSNAAQKSTTSSHLPQAYLNDPVKLEISQQFHAVRRDYQDTTNWQTRLWLSMSVVFQTVDAPAGKHTLSSPDVQRVS